MTRSTYALSQVVNLIGGGTPKRSEPSFWNGDIPWLSVKDLNNDSRYVINAEEYITRLGLEKSSTKILDPGMLIISARGTVGELAQLKSQMAFNQSCYGVDANPEYLENDYLYYLLKIKIRELKSIAHGSVFDTITRETFDNIFVSIPTKKEQLAIVEILGALDDKIDLNQKINETLEEIAKILFKSWFIDFDPVRAKAEGRPTGLSKEISDLFPDSFEESELGEIPKGWQIGKLVDVIFLDSGFAYKGIKKGIGENLLTTMGCVSYNSRFNDKGIHRYDGNFKDSAIVKPGDICISSHDVTQDRNHIGAPFIIPKTYENKSIASATNTFIVRIANEFSREFLYQTFKSKRFRQEMIASAKGTAIIHVSKDSVLNFKFCKPTNSIIENFSKLTQPIVYKLENNRDEIATLSELRDTLLPKLISGELKIPDAENLIEEAGI